MNALTDWLTSNKVGAKIGDALTSDRVLDFAASAIESPIGKVVMGVDKFFEEVLRENVSAALLTPEYLKKRESPIKAIQAAERISYGEAAAYQMSRGLLRETSKIPLFNKALEKSLGQEKRDKTYKIMPLLNPDYDLLDENQRLEAQDSAFYQLVTGLTDLGLEIYTAKHIGLGLSAARRLSRLSNKLDEKSVVKFGNEMDSAAADIKRQIDEGIDPKDLSAINGSAVHIVNILNTKNVTDLMNGNPMIATSLRPESLARLVKAAGDDVDAITYLLAADKGVPGALEKLSTVAPRYSDLITLTRQLDADVQKPLLFDDIDNIFVIPDNAEKIRLGRVLTDILQKDPNLGGSWLNWWEVSKLTPYQLSWAPTRSTFVEQMRAGQYGVLGARLTGVKPRVKDAEGITETVISDGLTRPFRVMTLSSLELKPRGYIQLTGLRPLDSVQEISAGLSQAKIMGKAEMTPVKQKLLDDWINTSPDEVSRAIKLKQIEVEAGVAMGREIANKLGIPKDINVDAAITEAIIRTQLKRDELLTSGKNTPNGIVSVEKGTGEVLAINETFKSYLPSNVPMLDFRLLEREITNQLKAATVLGKASKVWDRKGGVVPIDFNSFERAFSASVLIRPGYVPKNSIFEPAMRLLGVIHMVSLPKLFRNTSFKQELKDLDTGQTVVKNIDVMAPNTPGGMAAKSAIDPSITTINVTQPGMFERFSRGSGITQAVNPKDVATSQGFIKAYYRQYARDVNILKNDPVASLIMRGLTDDQIAASLLRNLENYGEFSDLNRIVQGRIAGGEVIESINRNVVDRIILESRQKLDELIPDKATQLRIAEDPNNFTVKKAREWLDQESLPSLDVELPFYAGLANQGVPSAVFEGIQRTINAGFRAIAKPEMVLFRSPFGAYYGNLAARTLFENAKKNGVEITNDLWQNTIRPISQEYALRQVENTFYAIRRMNNVQYYSRFLTAFPNAMFNSIKFWSRAGFSNPYSLVFLEKVRTSPWNVGMVVDEEGNPLTKEEADDKTAYLVFNTFSKQDEIDPFIYKMNVPQLNFLINGPSPNWLNQAAINTVIQKNPSVEIKMKEFLGEKLYNQLIYAGIPRGIVPPAQEREGATTAISTGLKFAENIARQFFVPLGLQDIIQVTANQLGKEELQYKRSAVASTIAAVHNARLFNWEMNDPDGPEPLVKDSIDQAMKVQWWQVARRVASFVGVTAQPTSILFRQEWDRIEKKYLENPELLQPNQSIYEATTFEFGQLYGDSGFKMLISAFEYNAQIAPEQQAVKRLKENPWINNWVGGNPKTRLSLIGIVTNPVIPGEYSPAASAFLRTEKIAGVPVVGQRKTFAERLAEAEIEDGWRAYARITQEKDLALANNNRRSKSLSSRINADINIQFKTELDELKQKNKAWAEEFGDSKNRFPEALNLIDEALKQKDFMQQINRSPEDKKLWDSIAEWKNIRSEIFPEWNVARPNSRQRRALKEQYESEVFRLIQDNTYFADFASRYFVGDPMMDIQELTEESLQPTQTPTDTSFFPSISDLLGAQ